MSMRPAKMMADKMLQMAMDDHLVNTRFDIKNALERFIGSGIKIDRRFERDFIKQTTDCVIDTCERYCSKYRHRKEEESSVRKVEDKKRHRSSERRPSKDGQNGDSKNATAKTSPRKRPHAKERSPDREPSAKRPKPDDSADVTDHTNIPMDVVKNDTPTKSEPPLADQPSFFFYCEHCLEANESGGDLVGGTITDVHKHWQSSHLVHLPSKPFEFSAAQIGVCHHGDAIGTYRELLKHQRQTHSGSDSLIIVSYEDRSKCGICLKMPALMADHFEAEHKTNSPAEWFNPMRFSDRQLDELLTIDVHKRLKCGNCDQIFETDNDFDIHHSIGHEGKPKLSMPHDEHADSHLICGYCQNKIDRDAYISHIKSHPYVFKCWKCSYQTNDLVNLVIHDKKLHERDTLAYHCHMFSEWLKSHFNKTKMVFPNGLAVKNFNLVGTKFDDSKVFGVYLDGFVELVRNKFELLDQIGAGFEIGEVHGKHGNGGADDGSTPTTTTATAVTTSTDDAFLLNELSKQNELANNLLIHCLPRSTTMDPIDIMMKLCERLEIKVSRDDILATQRRFDDLIVTLKSYELKEKIRNTASMYTINSGDIFDLHSDERNKRIKIISHTTRYYVEMLSIAREARRGRMIHWYELTKQGIEVKRSFTSDPRVFISKVELQNYIGRGKHD